MTNSNQKSWKINCNGKKLTISHKSYHPIETLLKLVTIWRCRDFFFYRSNQYLVLHPRDSCYLHSSFYFAFYFSFLLLVYVCHAIITLNSARVCLQGKLLKNNLGIRSFPYSKYFVQNLVLISDRSIRDPRVLRKWGTFSATMFNININLCAKNIGHCHLKTLNSKIWLVILPSCSYTFPLSATRGPLDFPSEKSFLFFFRPKGFRTHDSK